MGPGRPATRFILSHSVQYIWHMFHTMAISATHCHLFVCASLQGAECGEGLRRRNLSCVVHWGDWPELVPQPVEEKFCGDKLRQQIQQEMEQPCFVPCLGKTLLDPVHEGV